MASLPFIEAGLNLAQNNLDRSMQRDVERAERRRYERRKQERYEKLGKSFKEYDGRGYYRTVTPVTLKDGNNKTLDRWERVSNWRRVSSRR